MAEPLGGDVCHRHEGLPKAHDEEHTTMTDDPHTCARGALPHQGCHARPGQDGGALSN